MYYVNEQVSVAMVVHNLAITVLNYAMGLPSTSSAIELRKRLEAWVSDFEQASIRGFKEAKAEHDQAD